MDKVKGFLIDTPKRTIREVQYGGDIKEIYSLLGNGCKEFQGIVLNIRRDILYIDAEAKTLAGAKRYNPAHDLFVHKRYRGALIGRGLVLGTNDDGDAVDPSCTIEHLFHEIRFT